MGHIEGIPEVLCPDIATAMVDTPFGHLLLCCTHASFIGKPTGQCAEAFVVVNTETGDCEIVDVIPLGAGDNG
jgi:hypothetical protein